MSTDVQVKKVKPVKYIVLIILHYVHKVVVCLGRLFYKTYYSGEKKIIPPVTNPILRESVTSLAAKIRNKELTSVEVVEAFIARINEVNGLLNAVVDERYEAARAEAAAADALVRSGHASAEQLARDQPFLGVPFTTKDCIMVKGMLHTAGVVHRKDIRGHEDAKCVALLKTAGAIPIALTNVSEVCMWWESHNHVHGRTNNPYDTTRIVGGSSGGEGCLQAACGSAFGIGSDIGGSIRMPAFFNGVFGHKPSNFVVSNHGQYPATNTKIQDSFLGLGPMCRKASDLKPILEIISGENAQKLKLNEKVDLSTLKIFFQKYNNIPMLDPVDPEIQSVMIKAINHLATTFNLKPVETKIRNLRRSNDVWFAGMSGGESFEKLITGGESTLNLLLELVKNVFGYSNNTLIGIFTAIFEKLGVKEGDAGYMKMMELRETMIQEFKDLLGDNGVFLFPTHPTPAPYHNEPVIRAFNFNYTACINSLGFPATHIPMGLNKEGLPIGFQVVATPDNDRLCLAVAEELDKAFGGWVEPPGNKKAQ